MLSGDVQVLEKATEVKRMPSAVISKLTADG
jgi:hypothetical protein